LVRHVQRELLNGNRPFGRCADASLACERGDDSVYRGAMRQQPVAQHTLRDAGHGQSAGASRRRFFTREEPR
jgi:hypothetical protein